MTFTIIIVFVLFFVLAGLGMPVAFVLGFTGLIGLWITIGFDATLGIVGTTPFRQAATFVLSTLPMFILMAEVANASKITERLFNMAEQFFGHFRIGLGMATILAATLMGAISGSSLASTATFAATAAPAMEKRGYSRKLAMGIVASSGTIAMMIPPSIGFILYGIMTENSIGKLFLAGIFPGILTSIAYAVTLIIVLRKEKINPQQEMEYVSKQYSWSEKLKSIKSLIPVLIVGGIIMWGIYSGAMTATEAGAVGAFAMLVIAFFYRDFSLSGLNLAMVRSIKTTTMIMTIIISAYFFAYFMTTTRIADTVVSWAAGLPLPPHVLLAFILLIYIILGCFLDQIAILVITLPITYPLLMDMHFDPIWFGVIMVKVIEIGFLTPPFGLNVFVAAGARNIPSGIVFKGVMPFVVAEVVLIVILVAFPQLVTFFPDYVTSSRTP